MHGHRGTVKIVAVDSAALYDRVPAPVSGRAAVAVNGWDAVELSWQAAVVVVSGRAAEAVVSGRAVAAVHGWAAVDVSWQAEL